MTRCPQCKQDLPTEKKEPRYTGYWRYGLQSDPKDPRKSVKELAEVAVVDTICHRYRQNDSLRAIARWLQGMGLKNRSGGTWHHEQVRRILKQSGLL
jgi:hypothetical protein